METRISGGSQLRAELRDMIQMVVRKLDVQSVKKSFLVRTKDAQTEGKRDQEALESEVEKYEDRTSTFHFATIRSSMSQILDLRHKSLHPHSHIAIQGTRRHQKVIFYKCEDV